MILFGCTSVFQLLIIIYIMETEYKHDNRKKKLFILNHVIGLVSIYKKLMDSGFWDEIIIIHSDKTELVDINRQVDEIEFKAGDIFHLFGMEYVSFYMVNNLPRNVKCIFTDEGIMSKINLKESIDKFYNPAWFDGREFEYRRVDELWLIDERLSENNLQIPIKNLDMAANLKNAELKEIYLKSLAKLFPEAVNNTTYSMVFFDVYYLDVFGMIPPSLETYLLRELCAVLDGYNLVIKSHPGEINYEKYDNINSIVLKESYIPWEVLRLLENKQQSHQKRILIAYTISGAILSEKWLFHNEDTYIIFINEIYDRYSRKPVFFFNSFPKFIDVYGKDNIFFPKTFTELKNTVDRIMGKGEFNNDSFLESSIKEQENVLTWFIEDYKKSCFNRPSYYNYTTFLSKDENGWKTLGEIKFIPDECNQFVFTFNNSENEQTSTIYRWYAIRSRKVKIRLNSIVCNTDTKSKKIDMNSINNAPPKDRNGYFIFDDFDPIIEFQFLDKINSVIIDGEFLFDDVYVDIISNSNKLSNKYNALLMERDKIIEALSNDIFNRDEVIKNALSDIASRDKIIENLNDDIINRDEVIKNALSDIASRDKIIENLNDDIINRDEVIKNALNDLASRDNIIENLNNDIINRDEVIRNFETKHKKKFFHIRNKI